MLKKSEVLKRKKIEFIKSYTKNRKKIYIRSKFTEFLKNVNIIPSLTNTRRNFSNKLSSNILIVAIKFI